MAPKKPQQKTPEELFLQPLVEIALKLPQIEALVFWGEANGWAAQADETLDSQEIAFWAEGLLPEGFALEWRIEAGPDGRSPDHIRLYAWEAGAPPPPAPEAPVLGLARWPAGDTAGA